MISRIAAGPRFPEHLPSTGRNLGRLDRGGFGHGLSVREVPEEAIQFALDRVF